MALRPRSPHTAMGRAFEAALEAGLSMAIAVVLGYYADAWLGTRPIFLLIFLVAGFIAGFRRLLRIQWVPPDTGPPGDPLPGQRSGHGPRREGRAEHEDAERPPRAEARDDAKD